MRVLLFIQDHHFMFLDSTLRKELDLHKLFVDIEKVKRDRFIFKFEASLNFHVMIKLMEF